MAGERSMESRMGRAKQRYGEHGERLVAGIVPLSEDKARVLLISATRRSAWVIPKGGWETDEPNVQDAATREAWEEAGIVCSITADLGTIEEKRKLEQLTPEAPKAAYRFFEAVVVKLEEQWPEMDRRSRQWMTYPQAVAALTDRPELLDALNRSTISRN